MSNLAPPSFESATKILREVSYEERLGGFKLSATAGNIPYEFYNLESVVGFLRTDPLDALIRLANRSSVGYIDFAVLARWVKEVLSDEELAQAIQRATSLDKPYADQVVPVKRLLEQRLEQCQVATAKVDQPSTDSKLV